MTLNETHDPALSTWVASANGGQTDFPIQNLRAPHLPRGRRPRHHARLERRRGRPRVGVGDVSGTVLPAR